MILMALTPGHRRRWTVSSAPARTASVDRTVIETLLRDAVGAVSGIGPVEVRVSRRTAAVRATLTSEDRETALAEAQQAAHQALSACRLARPPRLRVAVRTTVPEVPVPEPGSVSGRFGAPRTPKDDDTPSIAIREGADA
ncbi:DUF6286 domain-containing protein [Streptomyces sp. NPDC058527]